jgi:hypothetical protein
MIETTGRVVAMEVAIETREETVLLKSLQRETIEEHAMTLAEIPREEAKRDKTTKTNTEERTLAAPAKSFNLTPRKRIGIGPEIPTEE